MSFHLTIFKFRQQTTSLLMAEPETWVRFLTARTSSYIEHKTVLTSVRAWFFCTHSRCQPEVNTKPAALSHSGINVCRAAVYLIFVDSVCIHLNLTGLLLKRHDWLLLWHGWLWSHTRTSSAPPTYTQMNKQLFGRMTEIQFEFWYYLLQFIFLRQKLVTPWISGRNI